MLNISEAEFAARLAERTRNLRLERALSQQELADRADVHRNVIISLEQGIRLARPSTVRKVARALGVPLAQLTTAS